MVTLGGWLRLKTNVTELIKNIRHPPKENCFLQNTFSVAAETEHRKFDQRIVEIL
jgi:hypothetical protein